MIATERETRVILKFSIRIFYSFNILPLCSALSTFNYVSFYFAISTCTSTGLDILLIFILSAWVASITLSISTLLSPFVGAVINRFGCRVVEVFGAVICTVSLLVTSFAEQMEFMYFSYGVIYGIGLSGISLVGFIVITKYFTKWRSFAIGMVSGGMGAGSLIFGPLLELLLSSLGWRWTFRVVAAIACVNVSLVCVLEPNEALVDEPKRRCDRQENRQQKKMFYFSAWKNYRFVLVTAGSCFVLSAKYIILVHLVRMYLLVNLCNPYITCSQIYCQQYHYIRTELPLCDLLWSSRLLSVLESLYSAQKLMARFITGACPKI